MLYPKKLFCLALLPTALAGKSASVTKTFKFKDDFHLKFHPLSTAIGPDNVDMLMAALNAFAQQFVDTWTDEISTKLQGGECTVNHMKLPEFSICDWKYPELYDVDELPTPGQCYEYDDGTDHGFIQRIYYKIKKLEITCPEDFGYEDLDKDAYTEAAFSGDVFLNIINPPGVECDGNESTCLFVTATSIEPISPEVCTAELFINRFVDIPLYLKCLDYIDGYGPEIADKLILAMDEFFETRVKKVLAREIMSEAPEGFIYNFVSPYSSDRKYCGHGSFYAGGSLVDQQLDDDGFLVTKFAFGFDVIWYKPEDFDDEILRDKDVPAIINSVFEDEDFLGFVRDNYEELGLVQDSDVCQLVDPEELPITFPPTEAPSPLPSKLPTGSPLIELIITTSPTISPNTNVPTVSPSLHPTTASPTISSPPTEMIWPSASPSQSHLPTSSTPTLNPSNLPTTGNPTLQPTSGNTEEAGTGQTLSPSPRPIESTPKPTCPGCVVHPDDLEKDECPIATTGTCGHGNRGDGICPYEGYCCSPWGYCGTTAEHCDVGGDSVVPTPSVVDAAPTAPTYQIDAGQCANGEEGDGFCPENSMCCSDWGYCGSGEAYCFTTRILTEDSDESSDGTCGGGGVGDGICADGLCCSKHGFCGSGGLYCTGLNDIEESDSSAGAITNSPLPNNLKPEFGFRCGVTEVDARANCKPQCTHHIQCSGGEECWGVQLNYCNTFREGDHPVCTDLVLADSESRCGYDEASARGHCGPKCTNDEECGVREFCFPTLLNLCECHEETCPEESAIAFQMAKARISPFFVESDPNNSVEGKPRSASVKTNMNVSASLLALFALVNLLM